MDQQTDTSISGFENKYKYPNPCALWPPQTKNGHHWCFRNCRECYTFASIKQSGSTCCRFVENTVWDWTKVFYRWTWSTHLYICVWALECVSLQEEIHTTDRPPCSHNTTSYDRIWSQPIAHLQMVRLTSSIQLWRPVCDRFEQSSCRYAQWACRRQ